MLSARVLCLVMLDILAEPDPVSIRYWTGSEFVPAVLDWGKTGGNGLTGGLGLAVVHTLSSEAGKFTAHPA